MNIVVLCGGNSTEREVSLKSGALVYDSLKRHNYNVCYLDLSQDIDIDLKAENPFIKKYDVEKIINNKHKSNSNKKIGNNVLEIMQLADLVFICLHGEDGEDSKIQSLLELYNIKYTGSNQIGCLLSMYKDITKELLIRNKIKTPKYIKYQENKSIKMKYPFVVKLINGGSSIGVNIVKSKNEFDCIKEILNGNYIIEKYIKGREFSVGILDNKALPVIEIKPKSGFYDYDNKYIYGNTIEVVPAKLNKKETKLIQETALKAHKALKLGYYSRVDFIRKSKNNFYCLEANALPGLTDVSLFPQEAAAIRIDFDRLCHMIVKSVLN